MNPHSERSTLWKILFSTGLLLIPLYRSLAGDLDPKLLGAWTNSGVASIDKMMVNGNHLFVAQDFFSRGVGELKILQIDDPAHPKLVTNLVFASRMRGFTTSKTVAYVALDSGLEILDVTNPGVPMSIGRVQFAGGGELISFQKYLITQRGNIFDVGDPKSPQLLTNFSQLESIQALTLGDEYLFVARSGRLDVLSLADPRSPQLISSIPGEFSSLSAQGSYLYAVQYGVLRIFDRSDPSSLREVGRYQTFVNPRSVQVFGNRAFLMEDTGLIYILDVSVPAVPRRIGGLWSRGRFTVAGDIGYVAIAQDVLGIYGLEPARILRSGSLPSAGMIQGVDFLGSLAYVADLDGGIKAVELNGPAGPVLVGGNDSGSSAYGLAIAGSLGYVASGTNGLEVFNLNSSSQAQRIGSLPLENFTYKVNVLGGKAFVLTAPYSGASSTLHVLDVSNPVQPRVLGKRSLGNYVEGFTVSASQVWTASGYFDRGVLQVWDVRNPSDIRRVTEYTTNRSFSDVTLSGNYVFAAGTNGLQVLEKDSSNRLRVVGSAPTRGGAQSVAISGTYAYVVDRTMGLTVFDVSTPSAPVWLGANTGFQGVQVKVADSRILVAGGTDGLIVLDEYFEGPGRVFSNSGLTDAGFKLRILGATGSRVRVERASALGGWAPWRSVSLDTNRLDLLDPEASSAGQFYRILPE